MEERRDLLERIYFSGMNELFSNFERGEGGWWHFEMRSKGLPGTTTTI